MVISQNNRQWPFFPPFTYKYCEEIGDYGNGTNKRYVQLPTRKAWVMCTLVILQKLTALDTIPATHLSCLQGEWAEDLITFNVRGRPTYHVLMYEVANVGAMT